MVLAERRDGTLAVEISFMCPECPEDGQLWSCGHEQKSSAKFNWEAWRDFKQLQSSRRYKGLNDYYMRDVHFLQQSKSYLTLGDHDKVQWVFDQMRNPSQGFGSYSEDQNEIDATLDRLFVELEDALTRRRAKDHIQTAEIDQGKTVKSRFWLRGRRLSL